MAEGLTFLIARDDTNLLRGSGYALILALLAGLFALRVLGQALQRWAPVAWLPPFDAFQGSNLPYWLLLGVQIVLLVVMLVVTSRVAAGAQQTSVLAARALAWIGGIYMTGSLGRIAVGLAIPDAPAWFTAWIPAVFHVVLAGFVLTLAAFYTS